MDTQVVDGAGLGTLLGLLADRDGLVREKARQALVDLGAASVAELNDLLRTAEPAQVRWEAAKALGQIGDPRSIQPLVEALADSDYDVAWLAAEGLRPFGQAAWLPLLTALRRDTPAFYAFRQGAHHVLNHQPADGMDDTLAALTEALGSYAPADVALTAADDLIRRLSPPPLAAAGG